MRIALVAFDYRPENVRLLPWRHIYELCRHFVKLNNEVIVITDGYPKLPATENTDDVLVVRLRHVRHFPPRDFDEMESTLSRIDPDAILWLMGLTSFFQRKLYENLKYPIVALVDAPIYWRSEILRNVNAVEMSRDRDVLSTSLAETFFPRSFIRDTFNLDAIKAVVTASRENKKRLELIGVHPRKIVHIPFGVDPYFLQVPSREEIDKARASARADDGRFLVTYFGPPLLTRGVDTLLRGTKFVLNRCPSLRHRLRILILSRRRGEEYSSHEKHLLALLDSLDMGEVVDVKSSIQSRKEIRAYVAASDLIALPFKHVIADTPLAITEALSLGKAVVSTRIDGIPEMLEDGRGFVVEPNDFKALGEIIIDLSKNGNELKRYAERTRRYTLGRPTWEESAHNLLALLRTLKKQDRRVDDTLGREGPRLD